MARFIPDLDAMDEIGDLLGQLGTVTKEDAWMMLEPAADLLAEKLTAKARAVFRPHSGKLADSISGIKKGAVDGGGPGILVYPHGEHHTYHGRKKKGRKEKEATAEEIAFVLEYGAPGRGIKATHWMEQTVDENEDAIHEAIKQGVEDFIARKEAGG